MSKVGKTVGSCTYVHRLYEDEVVPSHFLKKARKAAQGLIEGYIAVRYDKKNESVCFQFSPDFDNAEEPIVGDCILVKKDGSIKITRQKHNPQIWHHKWMWVKEDYEGFDYEASKKRSWLWQPHVTQEEKRKIGSKSFWDTIRSRWE